MLIAMVPVMFMVLGVLMWALAGNVTVKYAGAILFFCGTLVFTAVSAGVTWRVGSVPASISLIA